jgi:ATP-dependent 26S proteasome regulatory subunit
MRCGAPSSLSTSRSSADGIISFHLQGMLALRERRMKVIQADFKKAKEKALYRKNDQGPAGLYL